MGKKKNRKKTSGKKILKDSNGLPCAMVPVKEPLIKRWRRWWESLWNMNKDWLEEFYWDV